MDPFGAIIEAPVWWLSQQDAVVWWITTVLIGLFTFPLAFAFFRSLPDRGYAFAKIFGLVLTTYALWVGGYLHILPFERATIIALLALMAVGGAVLISRRRSEFRTYLAKQWPYMLAVEALFTLSFAVAIYLRSFVPEISIPEKTADFAFINGILRSDFFPPQDPWFSGDSISWYYFGHMNSATLTKLTDIPSRITFNLSIALVVALAATGVFGIVYNLLATRLRWRAMLFGLAGVVFLLFLSNVVGVVELLSANGVGSEGFYSLLDINGIDKAVESPKWYPTEWWWIVRSVQIASPWDGREFPFFTFLQGDLHAHMMVIPFNFLALAAILDFWRSDYLPMGHRGPRPSGIVSGLALSVTQAAQEGYQFWRRHPLRLAVMAVVVGATGFVELWALPAYLLLLVAIPIAKRYVRDHRLSVRSLQAGLAFGVPPAVLAVLAFAPFYGGLSSVSEGIQPIEVLHRGFAPLNATVTQPHHFFYQWLSHVWLLLSLLVVAVWVAVRRSTSQPTAADGRSPRVLLASAASVAWPALVPLGVWASLVLFKRGPLGLADEVATREASWITMLVLGGLLALVVLAFRRGAKGAAASEDKEGLLFIVMVVGVALLMLFGIELFWVQDPFGTRFNTVFRIGFQAWILLSVALAYALYFVFSQWRVQTLSGAAGKVAWAGVTAVIIIAALAYPLPATIWRTAEFKAGQTLDGLSYMKAFNLDGYEAILWLNENVPSDAVVLEVVGEDYNPARGQVSGATGRPTVLGWPWHECRWRAFGTCADPMSEEVLAERSGAVETIYTTNDLSQAADLLRQYGIDYVYVGPEERNIYGESGLEKFQHDAFEPVFTSQGVMIYRVTDGIESLAAASVPESASR